MDFLLEYVHNTANGTGYKIKSAAPEVIGQMFIDDSNWIITNTADMTAMIADCDDFVSFHGLRFNNRKCEYMAVNQPDCRGGSVHLQCMGSADQAEWRPHTCSP